MVKKQSSMAWDIKTMFHCSMVMFVLGGLASICRYYNQQEVSSNINVIIGTTATTITTTTISNTNTNTNTTIAEEVFTNTNTNTTKGEDEEVFTNTNSTKGEEEEQVFMNTNTNTTKGEEEQVFMNTNTNTTKGEEEQVFMNTNTNTTKGEEEEVVLASSNTTYTEGAKEEDFFDAQRWVKVTPPSLTETCDLFSGQWVHDNKSYYPLYKENECPRLRTDRACQIYGRKDSKYQQWRWQPHGCDLPRFNGKEVAERLRGKRLLFVGDSVNRNQYVSLTCMLYTSLPGEKKYGQGLNRTLHTYRFMDYNLSVDFHWAPMFVESNGDDPLNHRLDHRTVRIKSIESHARHWVDADILIFNNYLWWRLPIIKLLKGPGSLLGGPNQVYDEIDNVRAYKMVLKTWSKWVHSNIDHAKTKMYFMAPTATHSRATDWGGKKQTSCYKEKEPVTVDGFWESGTDPKMLRVLERSLHDLKAKGVNVQLINITQLTQYRKDAHPTIYRPLTDEQRNNPQRFSDCTHWCLPGVPDIWNELLLAYIAPVAG